MEEMGYEARPMPGKQRTAIGLVGNDGKVNADRLESLNGVMEVIHVSQPYKQVSREWRDEPTVIVADDSEVFLDLPSLSTFAYPKYEACTPAVGTIRQEVYDVLPFAPYPDEPFQHFERLVKSYTAFAWQDELYNVDRKSR